MINYILMFLALPVLFSCGKKADTPEECVYEFIEASRQHDMTKAWNLLGPDAVAYYNEVGDKNRKSGKGILEHDISEVVKFKKPDGEYEISSDPANKLRIAIISYNYSFEVQIVEDEGEFKIKNGASVHNILQAIASETVKKDYY